jgi:hypothetical protein
MTILWVHLSTVISVFVFREKKKCFQDSNWLGLGKVCQMVGFLEILKYKIQAETFSPVN